jgi:hypothetical protein
VDWEEMRMARNLRDVWAKMSYEISSSVCIVFGPLTDLFFWFIVSCVLASMYPFISFWVAWKFNINPLITVYGPLVPFTVAWYVIIRRRAKNSLAGLLAPQKTYDVDAAVETYVKLLQEQERRPRKSR